MKTVVVTGGTIRLGKAIADRLRAAGWRVITASHRPDSGADLVADLAEEGGAVRLYAQVLQLLGGNPPDAVVNNAALFVGDDAAIRNVNETAPKKLTMLMAGREYGRGSVVNILDSAVLGESVDSARSPAYTQSKAAMLEYTRKSAVMFAETLRVNAVAPGPVIAPVGVHELAGETLFGRPRVEDVASAVEYLLSAESTTGTVIPVDCGQHLVNCHIAPLPFRPENAILPR